MDKCSGAGEEEKRLLSVLCIFLCIFVLLGVLYGFAPMEGVKSVFPLLGEVSQGLDRVVWKLKIGSPIPEAVEAFFHEDIPDADSN